jgi:signal transduction histidine kinase
MSSITGLTTVLLISAVGTISVGMSGEDSGAVWAILACATALPAIAALSAALKGRRLGGREGLAWFMVAASMTFLTPVYLVEYLGAEALENVLLTAVYVVGALAILLVPLPDAGPYQRLVASLDALGLGVVVATGTYWLASGSGVDFAGYLTLTIGDAAIMAMVGYVAFRRSQRRGLDWPLLWMIAGVGAFMAGVLVVSVSSDPYFVGHHSDYVFLTGLMSFAVATLVPEQQVVRSQQVLRPVRWGHVLSPYVLIGALAVSLLVHQIQVWGEDPTRTGIELGLITTMLVVLARQLAMIAEQRRKVEVEQGGVIATISHELRTPLTTIVGFLDILEDWDEFSDAEKADMVDLARQQSHVMARVVGDLVDVARHKIEQTKVNVTNIRVDEFLDSAIDVVPELRGLSVRTEIAPGIRLSADRERMLQVAANLLSNAAAYGDGEVIIVVSEHAGDTVIEVHDNGPGIPDTFQHVIWERFERGPQRQSAIPGSGIGLAVARGLVRAHGGDTSYRASDRLGGACFEVRLPVASLRSQQPDIAAMR